MDDPGRPTSIILTFPLQRTRPPGLPRKKGLTQDFNIRLLLIPAVLERYLRSKALDRVPPQLLITMEKRLLLTYRPL